MIREKTIILTVYNVYCGYCGAQGPDAFSEVDAHIFARQQGWETDGDSYLCPDLKHAVLKEMREFLVDLKQPRDLSDESDMDLVTWWR